MRESRFAKLVVYALLLSGSVLFFAPFFWMILTSFREPREMTVAHAGLFPQAPSSSLLTPYVDARGLSDLAKLDHISDEVWRALQTPLSQLIDARVSATPLPPAVEGAKLEMRESALEMLNSRISDSARAAGPEAILSEAKRLLTEVEIQKASDAIFRKFIPGEVRSRTHDFIIHPLGTANDWAVEFGNATLQNVGERVLLADFSRESVVRLRFEPKGIEGTNEIDRLYVSFHSDASWSSITFRVTQSGVVYETKDVIHAGGNQWVEQELRWQEANIDPLETHLYATLYKSGVAPSNSPLLLEMTIRKSKLAGAWYAKAMHNYRQTFREVPFAQYLSTSFSLSILNIVFTLFSCSFVAYGFARFDWPGRDFFFVVLLATMMLPPQVTMIPSFLIIKSMGWYNTLLPLWVLSVFGTPFFIFLLRQFLRNVPVDLEDAARIDGCGFLRVYWHVMLPLLRPVLASVAIFTFMGTWNNFLGPLIYVNDERLFPIALGLFKFLLTTSASGDNIVQTMAASILMTLPVVILFFALQRYFIQGISLTGSKG